MPFTQKSLWELHLQSFRIGLSASMADTSKDYRTMTLEEMLALSGVERLKIMSQMNKAYREEILASFPPGLSEIETKRRLCERLYSDEVDVDGFVEYLRARERRLDAEQVPTVEDTKLLK